MVDSKPCRHLLTFLCVFPVCSVAREIISHGEKGFFSNLFIRQRNSPFSQCATKEDRVLDFNDFASGSYTPDFATELFRDFGGASIECQDRRGTNYGCRLFDTSNPMEDPDLGAPNEACPGGGPGVGNGGGPSSAFSNCAALGNVLIIDENGPNARPDDAWNGGTISFVFNETVALKEICFLDTDMGESVKMFSGGKMLENLSIPRAGDNGYVCVDLMDAESTKLMIEMDGSGAVSSLTYTVCITPVFIAPTDPCDGVSCPTGEACDSFTGQCQNIQNVVPCVAVIDEWDNRDYSSVWAEFRLLYPQRPFCLLVPNSQVQFLPNGFDLDTVNNPDGIDRTTVAMVNRDNGDVASESDWFNACNLSGLSPSSVSFIGLFIDTSGSMTLGTVQASYDKFLSDLGGRGLVFAQVFNELERYVDPFLTTLAPL